MHPVFAYRQSKTQRKDRKNKYPKIIKYIKVSVLIKVLNIIYYSVLIIVLYLKAKKEEMLWNEKLEEYTSYKERTKLFIPFIL